MVAKMCLDSRIILPLDVSDIAQSSNLVNQLARHVGVFKWGFESIYSTMAELLMHPEADAVHYLRRVRRLTMQMGPNKVFLDGKLSDIPNTVSKAVSAIAKMGVKMFNIHASAGVKVIKAASENKGKSLLFGVTVLTSISKDECWNIFAADPDDMVMRFARDLLENGADGVICAPVEGAMLRQNPEFEKLLIACPNVRPTWAADPDDQNKDRQMTPGDAIRAGIDMLVIGRPITKPPAVIGTPENAAQLINEEIKQALGE